MFSVVYTELLSVTRSVTMQISPQYNALLNTSTRGYTVMMVLIQYFILGLDNIETGKERRREEMCT